MPTIDATLEAAKASDLVFGVDTFTSHFAYLEAIPSVTVFTGSFWRAWRTPSHCALNASIHDDPQVVGSLLALLKEPPAQAACADIAQALIDSADLGYTSICKGDATGALAALADSERHAACLLAANPQAAALNDVPLEYVEALRSSLLASDHGSRAGHAMRTLGDRTRREWQDSNLYRYARFLVSARLLNVTRASV